MESKQLTENDVIELKTSLKNIGDTLEFIARRLTNIETKLSELSKEQAEENKPLRCGGVYRACDGVGGIFLV